MRESEEKKWTLEERMNLAAKAQASSSEAAVSLVRKFSRLHTGLIFHGESDFNLMYGLIGPYMDRVGDDILHYSGFCHSIDLAFADGEAQSNELNFRPGMGTRANNAIILLALMLLDHGKNRGKKKEVYYCLRMNLGQYLDALETFAFQKEGAPGASFRNWREKFSPSTLYPTDSLPDVLGDLLRTYIGGWKVLDSVDHVLRCMEGLSRDLEREPEANHPALVNHYMKLVNAYSWDMPEPAGKEISAGDVRNQIFLPDRDYNPQTLQALANEAPAPEFRDLLNHLIAGRNLASAMSKVNLAVTSLFMLLVGPYLWMD